MNWLEFFFGWLIKEQAKVTMLDGLIFYMEIIILVVIWVIIFAMKNKR